MRSVRLSVYVMCAGLACAVLMPQGAYAKCQTLQASHNGTDMFHETGAVGAAVNKLAFKVEQLKRENPGKRVRRGKVRTKCGPWFTKYLLPHRHCMATARVCY